MTGLHLSHYQIDAELGRGGMGVVYRATDTKLNRTVALKVLPAAALASPDDRARFVREAQSAAQLHHPNIATVFGIDEAVPEGDGVGGESRLFIAMEYIEGETLREHAQKGPMKLQQAVSIAGQIAEALKEAHVKDIVHRDIKSANIMLTAEGVAKVLDFGLAKTAASTMLTRMGSTLGTVAYMSPEQARGEEVDGRSDLYSLGTVLYEMISGVLPFAGDYEQAVLYGILNEDPEPLTAVRTGVPMQLEWLVNKLLAKEARHRYQTAADLIADLETLDLSGSGFSRRSMPAVAPARFAARVPRQTLLVALAALVIGLATGAAAMLLRPSPELAPRTVKRFDLPIEDAIQHGWASISPDGSQVAVQSEGGVTIVDLTTGVPTVLDTPGFLYARFSPDGEQLLFGSLEGLERSNIDGSERIPVIQRDGFTFAEWGSNGEIVYSALSSFVVTLPPAGVADTTHTAPGSVTAPATRLPDGRVLLGVAHLGDDVENMWAFDPATGDLDPVGGRVRRVLPSGHVILDDEDEVSLMAIDPTTFEPLGQAVRVPYLDDSVYDVADDGTLVYLPRPHDDGRQELRVLRADGTDELIAPDVGPEFDIVPSGDLIVTTIPSPDGPGDQRLTVIDVRSGLQTPVGGGEEVRNPRLHPSGLEIVGQNADADALVRTPTDQSEAPRELIRSMGQMGGVSWTADGTRMVWSRFTTEGELAAGIAVYDFEADSTWWLVDPDGLLFAPQVTADGRFVAYGKLRSAEALGLTVLEIETGRSWSVPVEEEWGEFRWSAAQPGLEFEAGDSLIVVPAQFEPTFRITGQAELVRVIRDQRNMRRLANGDIFYTRSIEPDEEVEEEALVLKVVINWFEEVKRLAPHPR